MGLTFMIHDSTLFSFLFAYFHNIVFTLNIKVYIFDCCRTYSLNRGLSTDVCRSVTHGALRRIFVENFVGGSDFCRCLRIFVHGSHFKFSKKHFKKFQIQPVKLRSLLLSGKCARRTKEKFSFKGTIKTPGYPRPYSLRQICLWRKKVPNGYRVHLDFDDKFGVRCESMDRVTVSVRRLYKNVRPRVSSSSTVVLCGQSRISNVTAPKREMWVRFQAHRNDTKGVGFRATYTSLGE